MVGSADRTLAEARDGLAIVYAPGDSADSVTQPVGLAETLSDGIKITWSSSVPSLIAVTGKVTRPAAGTAEVTLIATLTATRPSQVPLGQPFLTKTFKLVLASALETPTSPSLLQATGGEVQSASGTTKSKLLVGEAIAAAGSQSANGAVTVTHGFQTPE